MRLLVVCSSLDLRSPLSATPAWWQLLKALHEVGVEPIVTAYHGRVPETVWWRAYPNPARVEGQLFAAARGVARRLRRTRGEPDGRDPGHETAAQRAVRGIVRTVITPRWRRHLSRILRAEAPVDALLLVAVPPNHFRGVATFVRDTSGVPVLFYDGDAPASLPGQSGFATGFRIYDGADLGEFDAVVSNSRGAAPALRQLGARATHTVYYGADPDVYAPVSSPQDLDVLFYGHTAEYRGEWLRAMIATPAEKLAGVRFAVRGVGLGALGPVEPLPYRSFSGLRGYVARSKLNLVITRDAHARVYASSTMRPFELAMLGACMVANPCLGMEEWFEPGREVIVVGSAEEAIDRYRFLLAHDAERRAIGEAARRRALAEHTYRHRAAELLAIVKGLG
jgi:glycosyltransferase involved in cell wall biosynthesis